MTDSTLVHAQPSQVSRNNSKDKRDMLVLISALVMTCDSHRTVHPTFPHIFGQVPTWLPRWTIFGQH